MSLVEIAGFTAEIQSELSKFFDDTRELRRGRKVAVFDADGTLWRGDIGEAFFRHQVARMNVSAAPKVDDLWKHYWNELCNGDTAKALGWLAQWSAGSRDVDMKRWAEEFFEEIYSHHVFIPMRDLSHVFMNAGFETWVVTGSPRWAVQAAVRGFGIQADRVIGASVELKDGVLTDRLEHDVPYRAAKAELVSKIIGEKPLFAAGNTYWDKELLDTATKLALVISSELQGDTNFESEKKLQEYAKEKTGSGSAVKWLRQKF